MLSTISIDVPGYPFGSVTPYCVDRDCQPIVFISTIAQHTRNIIANPKVSLTVVEANSDSDDVQARGRLTLLADARPVDRANTEIRDRYLRYSHPRFSTKERTISVSTGSNSCGRDSSEDSGRSSG